MRQYGLDDAEATAKSAIARSPLHYRGSHLCDRIANSGPKNLAT